MKKLLCALFALIMCVSVFASCGGETTVTEAEGGEETTVAPAPEETEKIVADIPDVRFEDHVFVVWIQSGSENEYDFVTYEEQIGDPLNDAIALKNLNVEERFGITIEAVPVDYSVMTGQIRNNVRSGVPDFDIALCQMVEATTLALENTFLAFEQLEYIDLSKPWWDKAVSDAFSISGSLLLANGDISPSSFQVTSCLYFNKDIMKNLDLEYPYELVKQGKWTLDKMYEYVKGYTNDKNEDGKLSVFDDEFGLASWWLDVPYSMYYSAGGMIIGKDNEDIPYLAVDAEKTEAIYAKMRKILIEEESLVERTSLIDAHAAFAEDRAMFIDSKFVHLNLLRDMDSDYGILPVPKFDEAQEDYISFVNGCSNMLCIPFTCPDPERTSIIVEAIAEESYYTVTPVLYETFLKRKMTRDPDSAEMIDYIIRNRAFDFGYAAMQSSIGSMIRDIVVNDSEVVSTLARHSKSAPKTLRKMIERYQEAVEKGRG